MDATLPLLAADCDGDDTSYHSRSSNGRHDDNAHRHRTNGNRQYLIDDDNSQSSSFCCCFTHYTSSYKKLDSYGKPVRSNSTASTGSSGCSHSTGYGRCGSSRDHESDGSFCSKWACWKWIFPDRISDYDDFASSEEMGEIYFLRQTTREFYDPSNTNDAEMLQHLWQALFPTLPYDGRINPRWRDIGFQNDDPVSDFRSSGRFGCKMLLYFADYMNDEFKRLVRENRFPVCLIAINVIEMLLIHLNLKLPLALICPCCGTDNAELETTQPNRDHPELRGFISLLSDARWSSSHPNSTTKSMLNRVGGGFTTGEWPVESAFAQLFIHTMVVVDSVWRQKLHRDPTTTLLHFREALVDTRKKVVAFLSRQNSPVTLLELHAWSMRYHTSHLKFLHSNTA